MGHLPEPSEQPFEPSTETSHCASHILLLAHSLTTQLLSLHTLSSETTHGGLCKKDKHLVTREWNSLIELQQLR